MPDTSKANQLVLKKISDIALNLVSEKHENQFIATSPMSLPVSQGELEVMRDPDPNKFRTPESAHHFLRLSKLLNCVQDTDPVFSGMADNQDSLAIKWFSIAGGGNVEWAVARNDADNEKKYLDALKKLYTSESDNGFERTKTLDYQQYCDAKSDVLGKRIELLELKSRLTDSPPDERSQLEEDIADYQETIDLGEQLLSTLDSEHGFERAINITQGAGLPKWPHGYDPAELKNDLLGATDAVTQDTIIPCFFDDPGYLAEENWSPIRMTRDEIKSLSSEGTSADGDPEAQVLNDDDIEAIEMEVQVLTVYRPWMWTGFFSNPYWRWLVTGSEPVSDGAKDATGQIPAFITGLVFARNLVVRSSNPFTAKPGTAPGKHAIRIGNFYLNNEVLSRKGVTSLHSRSATEIKYAHMATSLREAGSATVSRPRTGAVLARAFRPPKPGAKIILSGVVTSTSGGQVSGARITVTSANKTTQLRTLANRQGKYSIRIPVKAKYRIEVKKRGYLATSKSMQLSKSTKLPFRLKSELEKSVPGAKPFRNLIIATRRMFPGGRRRIEDRSGRRPRVRDHRTKRPASPAPKFAVLTLRLTSDVPNEAFAGVKILLRSHSAKVTNTVRVNHKGEFKQKLRKGRYTLTVISDNHFVRKSVTTVNLIRDISVQVEMQSKFILKNDEVHVVAFICARTPRSPDPSPNAIWPA